MYELSRDPIIHAINNGIRHGITIAVEGGAYASAVILIYSGIDSMAYLGMPDNQEDVRKVDYIDWVERYLRFPCREQLTGADVYGARCAMLHNYGVYSRMSRAGECRIVGYMDKSVPEVRYNPDVNRQVVLVSVSALASAFSAGVDQFLIDSFSNLEGRKVIESRLETFVQCMPFIREETNTKSAT